MTQVFIDTLTNVYDRQRFKKFSLEFLNELEITETPIEVDKPNQKHIDSLTFLGSYEDRENKKLHLLEVKLKTDSKIEQARTMQRNLVAKYLKDHWLDGALVAFYSESSPGWRLSFVKIEYKFDENGKTKEELTPAKRYSFLVGKDEPTHTAQTQLFPIYNNTSQNPTLKQIEEAFGVEKVTKEFFEQYHNLFENVVAELKSSHAFQNEASRYNIDTENFAKKLLGQIVFLYFLQKKGWLGVPKGKSWGEGDKMFLRNIFKLAEENNKNFFNNYLEVLFYDTLNNPRSDKVDRNYSDFFESKIPFLNGGLFDHQYDWKNSSIYLNNNLFGNIFKVFDLYNFTVKEDEPLEKEVAVDPEMLGKVFENLLEENLRKGKGTYYTPREIVHYMCEESLINYLATEVGLTPEDVKNKYFPAYNTIEDEEFEVRDVSVSNKIIDSLTNIKVVDPACGSGAFLVGMLQQITQLRYDLEARAKLFGSRENASNEYEIKKQTIQNCIYGVDIDPGAVDIAKLRLWLSLVVDYDLEDIEPLPNLDYKIMAGNSLIELLSPVLLAISADKDRNNLIDQLNQAKVDYFNISDSQSKRQKRDEINSLIQSLVNYDIKQEKDKIFSRIIGKRNQVKLFSFGPEQQSFEDAVEIPKEIEKLSKLKDISGFDHFEWHLNFNEVFKKGGFDVVIANPPYVEFKKLIKSEKDKLVKLYQSAKGKFDLYVVFLELGAKLLNSHGFLTFIMPAMFMKRDYGEAIRGYITENLRILKIFDFADIQIFDSATNYTGIFFLSKDNLNNDKLFEYKRYRDIGRQILPDEFEESLHESKTNRLFDYIHVLNNSLDNKPWNFNLDHINKLFSKLRSNSIPLEALIEDFFEGIASGKDEVFYINQDIVDKNKIENQIIYKLLRGADVKKYKLDWSGTYVIYPYGENSRAYSEEYLSKNFPNAYSYLKSKRSLLSDRPYFRKSAKKWFELWNQRDVKKLKQMRVVTPEISRNNNFAFCEDFFGNTKTYNLILKNKERENYYYYLGLLNSRLLEFYYKNTSVPKAGGYIEYKKQFLDTIPIKQDDKFTNKIIGLVGKILLAIHPNSCLEDPLKKTEVDEYERQIDQLVYELYGLTEEEMKIVEGFNEK